MSLIAIACFDTEENERSKYTQETLLSLYDTVDWSKHRLFLIDNNSCVRTKKLLSGAKRTIPNTTVITLPENIGTAKAINLAWKHRNPEEFVVKMDNDCVINHKNPFDEMEDCLSKGDRIEPNLGILALKRTDLWENPHREDGWKSELYQLPHEQGERWHNIEIVNHAMGTVQMYHHKLIDVIGGLSQMDTLYGFDDSIAAVRCRKAGFCSAFLSHVKIVHLDNGDNPYSEEKRKYAGENMTLFNQWSAEYENGTRNIYVEL